MKPEMKTVKSKEFQAVFVGKTYEEREYDGLVVRDHYYEKSQLRVTKDKLLKKAHLRALRLLRESNYCFEDAPLGQEQQDEGFVYYYDFPVPVDWRNLKTEGPKT
jgi:hypothetical protein